MTPNFNPRAVGAAQRDALLLRAGVLDATAADPAGLDLWRRDDATLRGLLDACDAGARARGQVAAAGITSSDFGAALGDIVRAIAERSANATAEHRAVCATLPVGDFLETQFPAVDLEPSLKEIPENGEIHMHHVKVDSGQTAAVKSYGGGLSIDSRLVHDNRLDLIQRAALAHGRAASAAEAREIYGLLEANPTLWDGAPLFHEDLLNTVAGALDATRLGEAVGKLRRLELANGEPADLPARVLLVCAEEELSARYLIQRAGLGEQVRVIASGRLAATRWYVLPDPELAPVVGRLTLGPASTRVDRLRTRKDFRSDALHLAVITSFGVVALGRTAVRGGVE